VLAAMLIAQGCTLHDITTNPRNFDLTTSPAHRSIGRIHSRQFYVSVLWVFPVLPWGGYTLDDLYGETAYKAAQLGATGLIDFDTDMNTMYMPVLLIPLLLVGVIVTEDTISATMVVEK